MALAPPAAPPDRRPSPGLSLNLNSNNPFRNRANSPALASPASLTTPTPQSARPMSSTNPFLASFETETTKNEPSFRPMAPGDTARSSSPQKTAFDSDAKELFDNLTLSDEPAQNGLSMPKRSETLPVATHRPHRSDEDNRPRPDGGRRPSRPQIKPSDADPFASPERRNGPGPRPSRRNSESSINRPLTEEEKRARDLRRKERERRHRERRERDRDGKSSSSKPRRPNAGLDLIDKLDVTGIYGPGLFHHDGPFDACNPHRNRKRDIRAPMHAFPADSKNNTLGGSGPLNKNFDLDRIRGTAPEGYQDYSHANANANANANARRPNGDAYHPQLARKYSFESNRGADVYDPFAKMELRHGEETVGLGTSTFLEGTQASKSAMQRRDSENEVSLASNGAPMGATGGLGRKKSLAQRIRGISQPRRGDQYPLNGQAMKSPSSPDSPPRSGSTAGPVRPVYPASAGGRIGAAQGDKNPFFNDYDDAWEKKGASIKIAEQEIGGPSKEKPMQRARAPSSPRGVPLERSLTAGEEGVKPAMNAGGGGFLNRVKSLKRQKPKV